MALDEAMGTTGIHDIILDSCYFIWGRFAGKNNYTTIYDTTLDFCHFGPIPETEVRLRLAWQGFSYNCSCRS